ncbi:hypothetical protein C5167_043516 [Papaver somniferum]|uniref:Uncharacterized protein n=1 Tax=Papaver somniferum TaxID=3469 RepID=A0A4Y7L904_PAPSO|nr:hypothetical protein C5167_043516 [Papaver somniferum]
MECGDRARSSEEIESDASVCTIVFGSAGSNYCCQVCKICRGQALLAAALWLKDLHQHLSISHVILEGVQECHHCFKL